MAPSTLDILEWLRFLATIVTPFAVMGIGFWISARAASRKLLIENIDKKIEGLGRQVDTYQEECRADSRAIVVQVAAFQREVAERYPLKREVEDGFKSMRDDLRELRSLYYGERGRDDPGRRR